MSRSQRRCVTSCVRSLARALTLPTRGMSVFGYDLWECVLRESRSQHGEERMLLPTLIAAAGGLGRPGTFVELGALDGLTYSNTVALERCFNWTGLLIEANPSNFARLELSGRRAKMVHSAVCAGGGVVNISASSGATSRVVSKGVSVPCRPLPELMADAGLNGATFLSLDVEGSEGVVLDTVQDIGATFSFALVEGISTSGKKLPWKLLEDRGMQKAPDFANIAASECYRSVRVDLSTALSDPGGRDSHELEALRCVLRHGSSFERMLLPTILMPAVPQQPGPRLFLELMDSESTTSVTQALEHCFGWRGVRLTPGSAGNSTLSQLVHAHNLGETLDFVALHTEDAPRRYDLGLVTPTIKVEAVLVDWSFAYGVDRGVQDLWSRCTACRILKHTKLMLDRRLVTKPLSARKDTTQHPGRYSVYTTMRRCYAPIGSGTKVASSCFHKACVFGSTNHCGSYCSLGDQCASLL